MLPSFRAYSTQRLSKDYSVRVRLESVGAFTDSRMVNATPVTARNRSIMRGQCIFWHKAADVPVDLAHVRLQGVKADIGRQPMRFTVRAASMTSWLSVRPQTVFAGGLP